MGFVDRVEAKDVNSPESFANYCQQWVGIPYPTMAGMSMTKAAIKEFFATYPRADYQTLCQLANWARQKKKRYATVDRLIKGGTKFAWEDGMLPELDPVHELDELIALALEVEEDEVWRQYLVGGKSETAKQANYDLWKERRMRK